MTDTTIREQQVLKTSQAFWDAMLHSDETALRTIADPDCMFVHIGVTCGLDEEVNAFTSGVFQPTEIKLNSQDARIFGNGDTAVVITDCNYTLLLNGEETTHHFAVTEVYVPAGDAWHLVQFSFCALVY